MENWYLPITLVPGIGLLILSTSNLMVTLSNELSGRIKDKPYDDSIILRKLIQLEILNKVMVCFYVSVSCLAVAGLIGGLEIELIEKSPKYIIATGILVMLLGLFNLVRYSYRAVSIRQDQFKSENSNK